MLCLILSFVLLDYAGGFIYSKYKNRRSRKQKQTRKHTSIMKMAISFFNSRVGNTIKNIVSKVSVLVVKIKLLVCRATFERKCIFDHLFFNYKSKASRWDKSNTCLCVILHVKHKQLPIFSVLTWFIILGEIQDGGLDGKHVWWHYRPPAAPTPMKYTSSCGEDERLFTEGIFLGNTAAYQKLKKGASSTSPYLYNGGGMTACTSEGKLFISILYQTSNLWKKK